mgnify:FL=1
MIIFYLFIISIILIYYLYLWRMHCQIKEYYWTNLPDELKTYVNYVGHRYVFFITEIPWGKEEEKFQEKRNKILIDFDSEKGHAFIKAERNLSKCEWLFLLLLFLIIFIR